MYEKIVDYYHESESDYARIWGLNRHFALHYGYYDSTHRTHARAVDNLNHVLASVAHIGNNDHVLDAGCGVGGSSVWIAQHLGARATGINIVPEHVQRAQALAVECNVSDRAKFSVQDYTRTVFPDESFTVVWGIESVCHAESKKKFLQEAWRLLKAGGRIVIADGFLNEKPATIREASYLANFLDGWAVPNLASRVEFSDYLKQTGFRNIVFIEATDHVMPSSRRMHTLAILLYPVAKLMQWTGMRSEAQMKNMFSAYYQYLPLKHGLWSYGIFYAEKP